MPGAVNRAVRNAGTGRAASTGAGPAATARSSSASVPNRPSASVARASTWPGQELEPEHVGAHPAGDLLLAGAAHDRLELDPGAPDGHAQPAGAAGLRDGVGAERQGHLHAGERGVDEQDGLAVELAAAVHVEPDRGAPLGAELLVPDAADGDDEQPGVDAQPEHRAVRRPRDAVRQRGEAERGEHPPDRGEAGQGEQAGEQARGAGPAAVVVAGASLGGDGEAALLGRQQAQGGLQVGRHPDELEHGGDALGGHPAGQEAQGEALEQEGAAEPHQERAELGLDGDRAGRDDDHGGQQVAEAAPRVEPAAERAEVAEPLGDRQAGDEGRVLLAQDLHAAGAPADPLLEVLLGVGGGQAPGEHLVVVPRLPALAVQPDRGVDVLGDGLDRQAADLAEGVHADDGAGAAPEGRVPAVPAGLQRPVEQLLLAEPAGLGLPGEQPVEHP